MKTSTTDHNLGLQGFTSYTHDYNMWLRFTPALSTLCILIGTVLASPQILMVFSFISLIGALSEHHFFDLIYNFLVRPITKTESLSANPEPRRFAMFLAGIWSSLAALFFALGYTIAGYIAGGLLAVAGALVATTHFCLGSWIYRKIWASSPKPLNKFPR